MGYFPLGFRGRPEVSFVRMAAKSGRNDPCPCASGKKYKKCCGREDLLDSLMLRDDQLTATPADDYFRLLPLLALHGQKVVQFDEDGPEFKKAMKSFEKRYRPGQQGGLMDSFYISWLYFDLRFGESRRTIAERVLDDPLMAKLSEPGPAHIRHMAESYVSFYEVLESGPEVIILDELGTGRHYRVVLFNELFGPPGPALGDIWLTRLIGPAEGALSYTTPYVFDPETRGQFERVVRRQTKDFLRSPISLGVPAERLFAECQKASSLFWAEYILVGNSPSRQLLSSVPSRRPSARLPHVVNTSREEMVFTEVHFRITDEPALRKKLSAQKTFEYYEKDDSWTWLKRARGVDPEEPRTVLGSFRIRDGRLIVETNSRERAARIEALFAGRFRNVLVIEKTLYRHLDDLPEMSEEERETARRENEELNARPEVQAALLKHMEHHYFKKWPRQRIPALGNLTPLQASKTEKGRKKLRDLIDFFERAQTVREEPGPKVDFDFLRRMLGLLPKVN
jgi:hypothetical protein